MTHPQVIGQKFTPIRRFSVWKTHPCWPHIPNMTQNGSASPPPPGVYPKTVTWNFSESIKAFNSENIIQVCPVSFKTQGQCNSVKDALSGIRVIAFWCRAINDDLELGIFLQSMIFLEFQHSWFSFPIGCQVVFGS